MTVDRPAIESKFERWYLPFVLTVWCLAPGLRRVVDWQFGLTKLSVISILPLIVLLPLIVVVYRYARESRGVSLPFKSLVFFWLFGFVYAFVVALASKNLVGGIYDFAEFCLPLLLGAWVVGRNATRSQTFKTLTTTLLWLGVFESVYGIAQFISPTPWDVDYVNNSNQITLGVAEPYSLHPFSTLNSPGAFSIFLALVILLNLHRLRLDRPLPMIAVALCTAALILTNVRSSWLALAVGMAAYFVLSPKRGQAIVSFAAIGIVAAVFIANASLLLGNSDVTGQLQSRFSSFGSVNDDASLSARKSEADFALHQALDDPLGEGLGTVGTSAKLGGMLLDNGYLSRYLEMGLLGFVTYLAALALGMIFSFVALLKAIAARDATFVQISIYSLSIQAALIGLDFSSDFHNSFPGVFFWLLLGLALRVEPADAHETAFSGQSLSPGTSKSRALWA